METIIQVIDSPTGNIQLEKDFEKENGFDVLFVLQDDVRTAIEKIAPVTKWDDDVAIYNISTKVLGSVELEQTQTENDTLHIKIESALQDKIQTGSLDTLMAVNQANLLNRTFVTTKDNDTFYVSTNLGETEAGNFTIQGADSVNRSVIDFDENNHYKGFELTNSTNLTFKNVEIKNASELTAGNSTNVRINIYDTYLHDNGAGVYPSYR